MAIPFRLWEFQLLSSSNVFPIAAHPFSLFQSLFFWREVFSVTQNIHKKRGVVGTGNTSVFSWHQLRRFGGGQSFIVVWGVVGFFFLFWIFETRFHSIMQASLELETILLPQASKSWDDRCEPPLAAILYPEGKYGGGLSYLWVSLLPCSQHGFKNVTTPSVPEALINIGVFPHFCMATTPRIAPVLRSLEMAVAIGSRQLICSFCIIDLHMWGFS